MEARLLQRVAGRRLAALGHASPKDDVVLEDVIVGVGREEARVGRLERVAAGPESLSGSPTPRPLQLGGRRRRRFLRAESGSRTRVTLSACPELTAAMNASFVPVGGVPRTVRLGA